MIELIFLFTAAAAGSTPERIMADPVQNPEMAPARDGNIAIQEELCAARQAGTVAAYDLFIARHPQHPLAEIARQERARLMEKQQR